MPSAHRTSLAGAAVALTLTAACGSTVQLQGKVSSGDLGVQPATSAAGGATGGSVASPTSSSAQHARSGTTETAPDASTSTVEGGGSGGSTRARVVAPTTPVQVGFVTEGSDAALASGLGLTGVSNGDEPSYMKAVVDDVNASGGILGRRVQPIEYRLDPSTTENFSTIEQEECTKFVEDNHAVAALTAFHLTVGKTLAACMEQHHAATIDPTGYDGSGAGDYARFPHFFTPPGLAFERQAQAYVNGVNAQGFFRSGARIGLLSVDAPSYHAAVDHSLVPALKALGLKLYDQSYYPVPQRTSDIGTTANAIAGAELKFASEGISEVLFLESGALGVYEFARAASSQHYNPRYALSSTDVPAGLIGLGTPADQLANMIGVGWLPLSDVGSAQMGPPLTPAARCLSLMRRAGLSSTDDTVRSVQMEYCEELWFLKAAVEAGGGFTAEQIRTGVERLAGGFGSPQTPKTLFGIGRHDGPSTVRPLRYLTDCSCFRYAGPASPLD